MDDGDKIKVSRKKNTHSFIISGESVEINVFFNLNCLEKLFDSYEMSKDYRSAFSKVAHHMYHKSKDGAKDSELTDDNFISAADDELICILNTILSNDERLKAMYDRIDSENEFERFYKANEKLIEDSLKPMSDSLKYLNQVLTPQIAGIGKAVSQMSIQMNNLDIVNVDTLNQIALTLAKQVEFASSQARLISSNFFNNMPVLEFPQIKSVLDSIPKFNFDIAQILAPLTQHAAQMNENMRSNLSNAFSLYAGFLSGIDFSMLSYHKEWSEKHDFLIGCGWFYLNELPKEIIDSIYERNENLTSDEVDKVICDYFRQNKCYELKRIVKNWEVSSCFNLRKRVFHEALVNHSRRYYNSSTTLLVLHTEGVISDFVRIKLQKPKVKVNKAISDVTEFLGEIPMKMLSLSDFEIYKYVFERILDSFREGFDHANPDSASNSSRNKIAHGHAVDRESEVSSLRQFLYLNEVYRLFTMFDEKIFENKEVLKLNDERRCYN